MSEKEYKLPKIEQNNNAEEKNHKTTEMRTVEDTIEAINESNKKVKKHPKITITEENDKLYNKPKKTKLSKTLGSL